MAFGSLSPEARAAAAMRELGVSNTFVSVLCGIEPSKLSLALRQLKPLTKDEGERLLDTLHKLISIQEAIAPFSATSSPQSARLVLAAFADLDEETIRAQVSALFSAK